MRALYTYTLLVLFFLTQSVYAQYPSTLLADVKKQNPKEFITVTPVGNWLMTHDRIPDWQPHNACQHEVSITGAKQPDGTYWTYQALAIYHKAGNTFVFNRLFIIEDATKLNGVNLPDNDFFLNLFLTELKARNPMLMAMNYELKKAVGFYAFDIEKTPKITGSGTKLFAEYVVEVTLDLPNGLQVEKRKVPIYVKADQKDGRFVFNHARKKNDGPVLSQKSYQTPDQVEALPQYGNTTTPLEQMMR